MAVSIGIINALKNNPNSINELDLTKVKNRFITIKVTTVIIKVILVFICFSYRYLLFINAITLIINYQST